MLWLAGIWLTCSVLNGLFVFRAVEAPLWVALGIIALGPIGTVFCVWLASQMRIG